VLCPRTFVQTLTAVFPNHSLSKCVCITTIEYKHHPRRTTDHEEDWPRRPKRMNDHNDWSRRPRRTTDHDDWPRYDSAPFWLTRTRPCATSDVRGHVRMESFHCFAHCERTMRRVRCKKMSLHIFWHTSPWLCAVQSIISHWFTQCDVSLQNCIECETWRRASFH